MRVNGYDSAFPIIRKDGEIIDGHHRHEAALLAGVEPAFDDLLAANWDDTTILKYVARVNGDRRHLDKGQRAASAVLIKRKLGDEAGTVEELASASGVLVSAINRFATMDSDLLEDVVAGKTSQVEAKRKHVKDKGSRGGNTKAPKYTLSVKQQRAFASLGVAMDKAIGKIMAEAMDLGIASLESKYAAAGN